MTNADAYTIGWVYGLIVQATGAEPDQNAAQKPYSRQTFNPPGTLAISPGSAVAHWTTGLTLKQPEERKN